MNISQWAIGSVYSLQSFSCIKTKKLQSSPLFPFAPHFLPKSYDKFISHVFHTFTMSLNFSPQIACLWLVCDKLVGI